jgi:hypothetical protein
MKGGGKETHYHIERTVSHAKKTSLQIKNVPETKEKREEKNVWKHLERS